MKKKTLSQPKRSHLTILKLGAQSFLPEMAAIDTAAEHDSKPSSAVGNRASIAWSALLVRRFG